VVNASLNWASIVGIVLAVGGAFLYFMRSFKPALARDYDVFFAAIGLLCGGILFFQGWRLDPILQFGQFLLAGTTVFFAYESVRLRGVTTEQARRSSYFDDEEPDRFDEPEPLRRRIPSREEPEDDFYRPRRPSRAAIPERAASRRGDEPDAWDNPRGERSAARTERPPLDDRPERTAGRYSAGGQGRSATSDFGARRRDRDSAPEPRRGSRPVAAADSVPRSTRRGSAPTGREPGPAAATPPGTPMGTPIRPSSRGGAADDVSDADFSPMASGRPRPAAPDTRPPATEPPARPSTARDNSSRFDD